MPLLRIGDVAKLVGTTPRTIRYYEDIGLLAEPPERASGSHRLYDEPEIERLREVMRFKELLGVSLEELGTLLDAEEARAVVKAELRRSDIAPERRMALLREALGHIDHQLGLVRSRSSELATLQEELSSRRKRIKRKLRDLDAELSRDDGAARDDGPTRGDGPTRDDGPTRGDGPRGDGPTRGDGPARSGDTTLPTQAAQGAGHGA